MLRLIWNYSKKLSSYPYMTICHQKSLPGLKFGSCGCTICTGANPQSIQTNYVFGWMEYLSMCFLPLWHITIGHGLSMEIIGICSRVLSIMLEALRLRRWVLKSVCWSDYNAFDEENLNHQNKLKTLKQQISYFSFKWKNGNCWTRLQTLFEIRKSTKRPTWTLAWTMSLMFLYVPQILWGKYTWAIEILHMLFSVLILLLVLMWRWHELVARELLSSLT